MRYDTSVSFVRMQRTYQPATGNYDEEPVREIRFAAVMDTRTETMDLVYGGFRKGSLTVQLQDHYDEPFDFIEYNGRRYRVDAERALRTKHVFVVSEVHDGYQVQGS